MRHCVTQQEAAFDGVNERDVFPREDRGELGLIVRDRSTGLADVLLDPPDLPLHVPHRARRGRRAVHLSPSDFVVWDKDHGQCDAPAAGTEIGNRDRRLARSGIIEEDVSDPEQHSTQPIEPATTPHPSAASGQRIVVRPQGLRRSTHENVHRAVRVQIDDHGRKLRTCMERMGFEPTTPWLQIRSSPGSGSCSAPWHITGFPGVTSRTIPGFSRPVQEESISS
jgi:hypothetical protein